MTRRTKTFTKNERTYTYNYDSSEEDTDEEYINYYHDPNDSDEEDTGRGPSIKYLYEGKTVKSYEIQTQPYERKEKQQREADSLQCTHTFATIDTEDATQTDNNF